MKQSSLLILIIAALLFGVGLVSAAPPANLGEILRQTFQVINIPVAELYSQYPHLIDFILYLLIFIYISNYVMKERFGPQGKPLGIVFAVLFAIGAAVFEQRAGWSLGEIFPLALLVGVFLALWFLYRFLSIVIPDSALAKAIAYIIFFFVASSFAMKYMYRGSGGLTSTLVDYGIGFGYIGVFIAIIVIVKELFSFIGRGGGTTGKWHQPLQRGASSMGRGLGKGVGGLVGGLGSGFAQGARGGWNASKKGLDRLRNKLRRDSSIDTKLEKGKLRDEEEIKEETRKDEQLEKKEEELDQELKNLTGFESSEIERLVKLHQEAIVLLKKYREVDERQKKIEVMIQGGKIPSEVANKEMIELNNRARQIQRKIQEIANALAQTTGMITKVISKEEEDLAKELSVVEQELIDAKKEEKQATDLVNKTKKSLSQLFRDWKLARNRLLKAEQLHDIETIRSAEKEINDIINEIKNEKKELKYYEFLRRYATANFGRAQDKKRLIEKMLAILKQMDREAKQRLLITWREGMRTGNFQPFISELRKVERELIEEERLIDQERKNLRRSERTTLKEEYGTKQAERATSADIVRDRKIEFE